ncbi:MAG: carboxypeptidase regulatory-like domain-containing protein, partial [Planctomycetes bacterium]|nr:carboxypeptidase regulatory-like domain-containing protein [Planctomycetota bacterium]
LRALLSVELTTPDIGAEAAQAIDPVRQLHRRQVWSDADGRYRIDRLPVGQITLRLQNPRAATVVEVLMLAAGDHRERDFTLRRGHIVSGRLADIDGVPVRAWNIEARIVGSDSHAFARTAADGRFELAGLDAGRCQLMLQSSGESRDLLPFWEDGVEPGGPPLELTVLPGASGGRLIASLVAATNATLPRLRIAAIPVGYPPQWARQFRCHDPGEVVIGPLPAGEYDLEVLRRNRPAVAIGRFRVDGGTTTNLGRLIVPEPDGEPAEGR